MEEPPRKKRREHAPPRAFPAVPSPVEIPVPGPAPVAVEVGEAVEIPLTAMRRTIARPLRQSWLAPPHFYLTSAIHTRKLPDLPRQINDDPEKQPVARQVSFNDL